MYQNTSFWRVLLKPVADTLKEVSNMAVKPSDMPRKRPPLMVKPRMWVFRANDAAPKR